MAQGCCQLVGHSSTEEQGRQFTLNTAPVHWCLVIAHLSAEWIFKGVNAVAQGCCQLVWHSSTEEQGRQFTLNTAPVHWLVTAHRCRYSQVKMQWHKAAVTGWAQQHRRTRQAVYAEWIFIGKTAVAQGCCQLVWHNSTEEQGRQFS